MVPIFLNDCGVQPEWLIRRRGLWWGHASPHNFLMIVMAIFLFKVLQFLPSWHHHHADIVWQPADWAEGCVAFGASFPARSVDFGWKPVHQATRWCRTSVWSSTLCYKLVLGLKDVGWHNGRCQRKLKGLTAFHVWILCSNLPAGSKSRNRAR